MRKEINHTLGQEMDLEIDGQEVYVFSLSCQLWVCLRGGGVPQIGEVTRLGGVARLSI